MVGKKAGLGKAIHAGDNFSQDFAVLGKGWDVVFPFYVGRKYPCGNVHVFVVLGVFDGCDEIKVGYVNCHKFCVGGGQHAIEEGFSCGDVGGGGVGSSIVVDKVATNGEAYAVWVALLGAVIGADAQVRCFFVGRELAWALETNAVGGFGGVFAASVAETGKFFGAAIGPLVVVLGFE